MKGKILCNAALAVLLVVCAAMARGADYAPPEREGAGVIESLNFAKGEAIVDGYRYYLRPTTEVQIGGSYGAPTMLENGMRIAFVYERYDDNSRVMSQVRELSPNEELVTR